MEKICCECKKNKSVKEFFKDKYRKDGLVRICRDCCRIRWHKYVRREGSPRQIKKDPDLIPDGYKLCTECNTLKCVSEFWKARSKCKLCMSDIYKKRIAELDPSGSRIRNLKSKYGLTEQEYMKIHEEQDGRCKICGEPETSKRSLWLSVDHDHETGRIRGLLCRSCNTALGHAKENLEILYGLIFYIEENQLIK